MKAIANFILICLLLIGYSDCSSLKHFFEAVHVEGKWRQLAVRKPIGPCQPCYYVLNFDTENAQFIINNEQSLDTSKYSLKKQKMDSDIIFLNRVIHYEGRNTNPQLAQQKIKIKIQSDPKDGSRYFYSIEIQDLALYIQQNQKQNQYSLIIRSLVLIAILWAMLPIQRSQIQKTMLEMHKRSCLLSLYMYSQLLITIAIVQAVLAVQYVFNEVSIFMKLLCYCIIGFSFLSAILHSTVSIGIVQRKMSYYLPKENKFKFAISILSLFLGLILYPLFITTFHKGIWYFYFLTLGIIAQLFVSYNTKTMPYLKFLYFYAIYTIFLCLQTDQYPILNFSQQSYFQIFLFILFTTALLGGGIYALRKTANFENIANMFNLSNESRGQKDISTTQGTQNEGQIKQSEISNKVSEKQGNQFRFKSDIQLQPTL